MAENTNAQEPRELNDDELAEALGGYGEWSSWQESSMKRQWVRRSNEGDTSLDFEDWVASHYDPDRIPARNAWIAAGKPEDVVYHFEDGNVWTTQ